MPDRPLFAADFLTTCNRGFDCLSAEVQEYMRKAVTASQAADGLFAGRGGNGDLYYSFFGLLLAVVTNAKIRVKACRNALTLIKFNTLDLVHGCIRLRIDNLLKLLELPRFMYSNAVKYIPPPGDRDTEKKLRHLAALPAAAFPQSDPGSPYSRFLLATLYADSGEETPEMDPGSYRLPSGLYSNLKNGMEYGVNATASALFFIPESLRQETAEELCRLQEDDGSFKAVENAPGGDLLSTGTAFFALNRYGASPKLSAKPFLRSCFRENGLFAATPEDPCGDLEYTVYALLALGGSV